MVDSMDIEILMVMLHSLLDLMLMVHIGRVLQMDRTQSCFTLPQDMHDIVQMGRTIHEHVIVLVGSMEIMDSLLFRVHTVRLQMFDVLNINNVNRFSPDFIGSFFVFI
jgi:hypothetical protein